MENTHRTFNSIYRCFKPVGSTKIHIYFEYFYMSEIVHLKNIKHTEYLISCQKKDSGKKLTCDPTVLQLISKE